MSDDEAVRIADAKRQAELVTLHLHRAYAINVYAEVEQSLCNLFSHLLGTTFEWGLIVFYRLTNTHSRNAILEELLRKRYGDKYDAYWNGTPNTHPRKGMAGLIRQLDQKRNEIVHWRLSVLFQPGDNSPSLVALKKPDRFTPIMYDQNQPTIKAEDLTAFITKGSFVCRSLNMLLVHANGGLGPTDPLHAVWQQIFQQPASYPPADTNPLSPNWKAPETPPQPSDE